MLQAMADVGMLHYYVWNLFYPHFQTQLGDTASVGDCELLYIIYSSTQLVIIVFQFHFIYVYITSSDDMYTYMV